LQAVKEVEDKSLQMSQDAAQFASAAKQLKERFKNQSSGFGWF
jgi:hypothetical protein